MASCRLRIIREVVFIIMLEKLISSPNLFMIILLLMSIILDLLILGAMGDTVLRVDGLGWTDACEIWLDCSNTIYLKYLPKIISDHSPMLISIAKVNFPSYKIFYFENYWLEHASKIFEIKKALPFNAHSNPMHAFYHVLAWVRRGIGSIRQHGLGTLDMEIRNIEGQLQALEVGDMLGSYVDLDSFRSLQNRYRALLRQNHSRWA